VLDVLTPGSSFEIGGVTFMDARQTTVMRPFLSDDLGPNLLAHWDSPTFARTVVDSLDLWSAKAAGVARVRDALGVLTFRLSFSSALFKEAGGEHSTVGFERPSCACPAVADAVLVHNMDTDEHWLAPVLLHGKPHDLVRLSERGGRLLHLLEDFAQPASGGSLHDHIHRAIHWSYRAVASDSSVDQFLMRWIALEMLLLGTRREGTSTLRRRLPFAIASPEDKVGPIRAELEKRWIPLRDSIAHRAILEDPNLEEGIQRVKYFVDVTVAHALAMAEKGLSFTDWLSHLDEMARTPPRKA